MKPKIYLPILSLSFILLSRAGTYAQVILDSSFGSSGIVITSANDASEINSLAIQPDGKIVAAGYSLTGTNYHFMIARYNTNGTPDNSFGAGGTVNTSINNSDMPYSVVIQPDGKIIVAGNYYDGTASTTGNYHSAIARYNTDGSPDNSFGPAGIVTTIIDTSEDDMISSIALQTDGKIVAGGYAGNQFLLMRYTGDGTLDSSFGTAGKVFTTIESQSSIYSIAIQYDGKIVTSGNTGSISNFKFALARYDTDGTLDAGFGTGGTVVTDLSAVFYEVCYSLALQADHKIVTAGFSGNNCALVRYNTDGSLDNGFGIGGKVIADSFPGAKGLAIQPDGKLIVNGNVLISPYNNGYSLSRFKTDGTPDSSFGNAGSVITDIDTGNDYSQCVSLQPYGKIIMAGSSRASAASPAYFTLARFTSDLTGVNDVFSSMPYWRIFPNPAKETLRIETGTKVFLRTIQLHDITGKLIRTFSPPDALLNIEDIAQGQYLLKIITDKGVCTKKILKQ